MATWVYAWIYLPQLQVQNPPFLVFRHKGICTSFRLDICLWQYLHLELEPGCSRSRAGSYRAPRRQSTGVAPHPRLASTWLCACLAPLGVTYVQAACFLRSPSSGRCMLAPAGCAWRRSSGPATWADPGTRQPTTPLRSSGQLYSSSSRHGGSSQPTSSKQTTQQRMLPPHLVPLKFYWTASQRHNC